MSAKSALFLAGTLGLGLVILGWGERPFTVPPDPSAVVSTQETDTAAELEVAAVGGVREAAEPGTESGGMEVRVRPAPITGSQGLQVTMVSPEGGLLRGLSGQAKFRDAWVGIQAVETSKEAALRFVNPSFFGSDRTARAGQAAVLLEDGDVGWVASLAMGDRWVHEGQVMGRVVATPHALLASGTVLLDGGQPASGAGVVVYQENADGEYQLVDRVVCGPPTRKTPPASGVHTNEQGMFTVFANLPSKPTRLLVYEWGHVPAWVDCGRPSPPGTTHLVRLKRGCLARGEIELGLLPPSKIDITVVDANTGEVLAHPPLQFGDGAYRFETQQSLPEVAAYVSVGLKGGGELRRSATALLTPGEATTFAVVDVSAVLQVCHLYPIDDAGPVLRVHAQLLEEREGVHCWSSSIRMPEGGIVVCGEDIEGVRLLLRGPVERQKVTLSAGDTIRSVRVTRKE